MHAWKERGEEQKEMDTYGPMSDGVAGSEGGGGRLINVGGAIYDLCFVKNLRNSFPIQPNERELQSVALRCGFLSSQLDR